MYLESHIELQELQVHFMPAGGNRDRRPTAGSKSSLFLKIRSVLSTFYFSLFSFLLYERLNFFLIKKTHCEYYLVRSGVSSSSLPQDASLVPACDVP